MCLLFLLWIALNGSITPEILLTGLALTAGIGMLARRLTGCTAKTELFLLKKLPLLIAYFSVLLCEILKASFSVILLILSPRGSIQPVLLCFSPPVRTAFGQYLLANSITLTPGTITVEIKEGEFTVHCLKASLLDTSEHNILIRLLRRLET